MVDCTRKEPGKLKLARESNSVYFEQFDSGNIGFGGTKLLMDGINKLSNHDAVK